MALFLIILFSRAMESLIAAPHKLDRFSSRNALGAH